MALQVQIWVDYIVEALFPDDSFINKAMNWDGYVREGVSVHVPQAGDPSDIEENVTVFPIAPTERLDGELVFNLDTFYVKPVRLPKIDEYELSYNKRESVLGLNLKALKERIALTVLYRWAAAHGIDTAGNALPAAPVIRTTGTAIKATFSKYIGSGGARQLKSATGNRKRLTKEDMVNLQLLFDQQDMPADGRNIVIPAGMMNGLMLDSDLMKRDNALELDPKTGEVKRLYGFTIIKRSMGLAYSNAATPVAFTPNQVRTATEAGIAAYNNAAFAWSEYAVGKAKGPTEVFDDPGNPLYYADLVSYLAKFGACKGRLDAAGVAALVEEVAA